MNNPSDVGSGAGWLSATLIHPTLGSNMKKVFLAAALLAGVSLAHAQTTYVRPSVDKNGNYREGHVRSNPDQIRSNNLNAENNQYGGVNPYTGQRGHQKDEYSNPPQYNQSYGQPQGGQRRNQYGY
ncbi:hypothetical protein [Cupriavidus numazuensis]|uniref:Uncharacterized protein n=1 Tax=Cupriavidus numazuensis TaxID=221992 RepID=A0ABM8TAX1_9BURK|nr:hypothetical protein [Cupriavidus numazuensis]CAG2132291.1 hypothetical protein LMG26411_00590 [Cupriavidus numazuensis]